MFWFSLALVLISSEIITAYLYVTLRAKPALNPNESLEELEELEELKEKIKLLEDQVSSLRVAQGMRRRDG